MPYNLLLQGRKTSQKRIFIAHILSISIAPTDSSDGSSNDSNLCLPVNQHFTTFGGEAQQWNPQPSEHLVWQRGARDSKQIKYSAFSQTKYDCFTKPIVSVRRVLKIRMILKRPITSGVRVMSSVTEKFSNINCLSFHRPLLGASRTTSRQKHREVPQLSSLAHSPATREALKY